MKAKEVIKQYFKDHPWTSPEGNELAIRKSDYTIIDVTLTEELAFEEGMKQAISKAKKGIEETLECERQTFDDGGEQDKNIQGWIEGLEYALRELQLVLEPEETPEPEPVAIIEPSLQAYMDGVALNILYSNFYKGMNGIWSRAEVDDHWEQDGDVPEVWDVTIDFGCQDDTRNESYREKMYFFKKDGEWTCDDVSPIDEEGK